MLVTPIYASLLTFLFVVLSVRVIGFRRTARVALGDGGDANLMRRIRVQANFAEYVPLALLLLALAEAQRSPTWTIHLLGLLLVAGRTIHGYGVGRNPEARYCRVLGMAFTFAVLLTASGLNLILVAMKL
jgi:uncharacterized protein